LLLANVRPEDQAKWMQRSYYRHLPRRPLTSDAIGDLLRDHLGQDASVAALPEMIRDRTKGNPLHAAVAVLVAFYGPVRGFFRGLRVRFYPIYRRRRCHRHDDRRSGALCRAE